jgi:hypothetical protein
MVDTNEAFPQKCLSFPDSHVRSRKRKRSQSDANETETTASKCTLCLRYNSMLGMDFIGSEEMVIVEQPWLSVVATFPAALERRVYGS